MAYENRLGGLAGNAAACLQQDGTKAACEKRNTIEDQMRLLSDLVQRIEQIKANVRGISDQICGVSGTLPEGEKTNPAVVSPDHILYRLTDAIRDGIMAADSIDRELSYIRSALSDDSNRVIF
jgi:hypothetical protein